MNLDKGQSRRGSDDVVDGGNPRGLGHWRGKYQASKLVPNDPSKYSPAESLTRGRRRRHRHIYISCNAQLIGSAETRPTPCTLAESSRKISRHPIEGVWNL
jgi:hypothetical protein